MIRCIVVFLKTPFPKLFICGALKQHDRKEQNRYIQKKGFCHCCISEKTAQFPPKKRRDSKHHYRYGCGSLKTIQEDHHPATLHCVRTVVPGRTQAQTLDQRIGPSKFLDTGFAFVHFQKITGKVM